MWAGMSSGPSSVCVQPPRSSGTAASNQVSKSRRTSGEAFSLSVSDAEVWRMCRWHRPTSSSASSGSGALDLARDEMKATGTGLERDLALQPHRPPDATGTLQ